MKAIKTESTAPLIWQLENTRFQRIKRLTETHGLSVLHLTYAVLSGYFSRITGEEEIVIDVPVHNRKNARQKDTVGLFAAVIPVKITLKLTRDTFFDVMKKAAEELRRCYKHQHLSITKINEQTKIKQKTGRAQLFDITLSFELFRLNVDMQGCVTRLEILSNHVSACFISTFLPKTAKR
ncbi:condensation domain-containing protein [Erwinia psidii]|uniref:Condensation domain-containing protein n=1 Tax=Erwinia psidii TaxID=69224 RepID=A0A3N6S1I6_9GAMM|nr:condensation domain-containing protein [Erwinia psidii]MCX8955980.1 hypothetical protein [Erwinia psidii]MCX8963802.1 hypothetical protein [Erwinia psidii]RQM38687.1 hypothetical protein EB241_08335 [Erwinia psidii]